MIDRFKFESKIKKTSSLLSTAHLSLCPVQMI